MKTVITIIAELIRSLVMSGLVTVGALLLVIAALVGAGYALWQLLRR